MEHDRFRRQLILNAVLDRDTQADDDFDEEPLPRVSDRETEDADRADLEELCDQFDKLHSAARQKMWDLIKIPIAPASLIAIGIEGAVVLGFVQKELGYLAMIADGAWATYKLVNALLDRSLASAGKEAAISNIQAFLHTQKERAFMMHRAIIDAHEPALREALQHTSHY